MTHGQDNGKIVVMTGAGVSAESGLGTFRDAGGLWTQVDLMEVATPEGFARNPEKVFDFYNARRANAARAQPNPAHLALGRLSQALGPNFTLITQNVDGLHEAGGAAALHMHGRLSRARCAACGVDWDAPEIMHPCDPCPVCTRPETRPDVVWFGEMPHHLDEIAEHLESADIFAVIGTSGTVWPAAGFAETARDAGAATVEFNLERTPLSGLFERIILGPAATTVPIWVDELLG